MHGYTGTFARRKQPGESRVFIIDDHFAIFIRRDAAHRVMRGRLDGHQLGDWVNAQVDAAEIHNIGNLLQDRCRL